MQPANRLYSGICIGAISAKQPSRRPFRLYLAIPLCRRCSDAPDCPLYHPRSDAPVTLPLRPCLDAIPLFRCAAPFRSNPLHCGIAPLEGSSPPYRAGLFRHKLVILLYRFCLNILHCPAAASLADHPLPPAPCLSTTPFPRWATPFGCTPLSRYAAAHRQHPLPCHTETALLWRSCSNNPRCSSMPYCSKATPLPLPPV